jgi:[protein-PII] uridylyltransferase
MPTSLQRDDLLADPTLRGSAWCHAHTARIDAWIRELWAEVAADVPGVALVATGGHGRAELCPQSDLDLLLVVRNHDKRTNELASGLWYPMWDQGLKLGHSVRTVDEALALAKDDLDTATALLTTRHLAGDEALARTLGERALGQWRTGAKRAIQELAERVERRHERVGEVAFLLEPDLKEGRGGLRDVHALSWLDLAQPVLSPSDEASLRESYEVLLAARVELHRRSGRRSDVLLLQEQDAIAGALGVRDADVLMKHVAASARAIAWTSDIVWHRVRAVSRRGKLFRDRPREVSPGVVLEDRTIRLSPDAEIDDAALILRVALAAATQRAYIDRDTLERLADESPKMPEPWPDEARWLFTDLLMVGHPAIPVIEALDQLGLFHRLVPEWEPVRSRPQRNAYHRFTVDRHLCEAAAEAAALIDRVDRPDLLVVGALLHDIGKGYSGNHIEVGIQLVDRIATRMGYSDAEVAALVSMVRHHLLLPDVATRRDLDDDGTIRSVATQVGSVETLELLAALTEADSIATGPAAWGTWKAGLVADLVARTAHVLRGGDASELGDSGFPTDEHHRLIEQRVSVIDGDGDTLTVIVPDRPGLFSRVAGVLSLNGVDVQEASAHTENGMALEVYRVRTLFDNDIRWDRIERDVERALSGRLALRARLAERARTYPAPKPTAARPTAPRVVVDNHTSDVATVVEVQAGDGIGVLYRITQALLECDLDIVSAKVQTLGSDAVDAFYVLDRAGEKVTDAADLGEIERAILHALATQL